MLSTNTNYLNVENHQTSNQQQETNENKIIYKNLSEDSAGFLRAARAGNLDKVLEYLNNNIDINVSNSNGLNALHLASKEGHIDIVTELLNKNALVDAATKKGNTALHIASLAGQEEIVKILIQFGANVNCRSQNGFTPLYMAAQENHLDIVKYLLANNANQSLATEDNFTPLAVALQQGHEKVVAILLENDSKGKIRLPALHIAAKKNDVKAAALLLQNDESIELSPEAGKSGFTPLHIASHYGNIEIASYLISRGANVNYEARQSITPLHVAAKWGKAQMVRLLLDNGALIDAKTRDGLTPLHCAARSGHDQIVELLFQRGASINSKTKNGLTALHMAAQGDHVEAARILLYNSSILVDQTTCDYLTALHVAAHCGHVKIAKLLLERKADVNSRALNGFTPLHIACKKNRIKVIELLIKNGAAKEATTESGLTPLHVASFMGCMNVVVFLIQHGSVPNVQTIRGETPLHLAARASQTDIVRILLRHGANVDAKAKEQQTPLHIATRLGNTDIVSLLLRHGANVDIATTDGYTALHIASKEGHEEVASVLLEYGASLNVVTNKGFTPLHIASKYGNVQVASLLLQRKAAPDIQGKNGLTPLHVATHYNRPNVAHLLLEHGASPHIVAKNGYTALHIAAKKYQMEIATTLLEYSAKTNCESNAGFTPLHLSCQEGHIDMTALLLEHEANANSTSKNGLTPLHLCAQEDKVNCAAILVKYDSNLDAQTKAGYTPLHVACHFGQINMVKFLLQYSANVNMLTKHGFTPLHCAAQQGHVLIAKLLVENGASPDILNTNGQTPLAIAQRLGYISVIEELKLVTQTTLVQTTTNIIEEKYKVQTPETMQETFMSDSEDEMGDDVMFGDTEQHYKYLTNEADLNNLGDDSVALTPKTPKRGEEIQLKMNDTQTQVQQQSLNETQQQDQNQLQINTKISYGNMSTESMDGSYYSNNAITQQETTKLLLNNNSSLLTNHDNVSLQASKQKISGLKWQTFLISFMVDARGGTMRGSRHSGVRIIIPPKRACMPTRITCRFLRKEKMSLTPPLNEGEALAARILEMGPQGNKFLGPVVIEIPHYASLREKDREILVLRSDNGEKWTEHPIQTSENSLEEAIGSYVNLLDENQNDSDSSSLMQTNVLRIITTDFPRYFALVSRVKQETHAISEIGGVISSTVVPKAQAVFPEKALQKKIKLSLQAMPVKNEIVHKLFGNRVAVSPIVTIEPRRRKFHKAITLTIPLPKIAHSKDATTKESTNTANLRLLCSITGGYQPAQWEDITGHTPLSYVDECVSFTTTVSARFWLMDCQNSNDATRMATEIYREIVAVPFISRFVVFAKRHEFNEATLRLFCLTDDKEDDKTLEKRENYVLIAKSKEIEVYENTRQWLEMVGNIVPINKSSDGEQLNLLFNAFKENRLQFNVRIKDTDSGDIANANGRLALFRDPKGFVSKSDTKIQPLLNLDIELPAFNKEEIEAETQKRLTLSKSSQLIFKQFSASDLLLKDKDEVRKYILESKDSLGKASEINEYSENYTVEKNNRSQLKKFSHLVPNRFYTKSFASDENNTPRHSKIDDIESKLIELVNGSTSISLNEKTEDVTSKKCEFYEKSVISEEPLTKTAQIIVEQAFNNIKNSTANDEVSQNLSETKITETKIEEDSEQNIEINNESEASHEIETNLTNTLVKIIISNSEEVDILKESESFHESLKEIEKNEGEEKQDLTNVLFSTLTSASISENNIIDEDKNQNKIDNEDKYELPIEDINESLIRDNEILENNEASNEIKENNQIINDDKDKQLSKEESVEVKSEHFLTNINRQDSNINNQIPLTPNPSIESSEDQNNQEVNIESDTLLSNVTTIFTNSNENTQLLEQIDYDILNEDDEETLIQKQAAEIVSNVIVSVIQSDRINLDETLSSQSSVEKNEEEIKNKIPNSSTKSSLIESSSVESQMQYSILNTVLQPMSESTENLLAEPSKFDNSSSSYSLSENQISKSVSFNQNELANTLVNQVIEQAKDITKEDTTIDSPTRTSDNVETFLKCVISQINESDNSNRNSQAFDMSTSSINVSKDNFESHESIKQSESTDILIKYSMSTSQLSLDNSHHEQQQKTDIKTDNIENLLNTIIKEIENKPDDLYKTNLDLSTSIDLPNVTQSQLEISATTSTEQEANIAKEEVEE